MTPPATSATISEISCYRVTVTPPGGAFTMSRGRRYDALTTTIVQVVADDGTYGLGEASTLGGNYLEGFPAGTEAAVAMLGPHLLGLPVGRPHAVNRLMDGVLLGHLPAKAAIDAALWDLWGKLLGLPVADLLGGRAAASFPSWTAIGVGSSEDAVRDARACLDLGYVNLQVKVGDDPRVDADRLGRVVAAVGDRIGYLACDANCGWTTAEALEFAQRLDDPGIYLEQPCPSLTELAHLAARIANPLVLDEAAKQPRDLLDAVGAGCVNAVNIKPVRVGGLTKAAVLRDIAQTAGLRILVDEPMGGNIAGAGIASLAATVNPSLLIAGTWFGDHAYSTPGGPVTSTGPTFDEGRVLPGWEPGLGGNIELEALGEPQLSLRG